MFRGTLGVGGGTLPPHEMSTKLAVQIGDVTPANVAQLKTLNVNTLPVRYSDKFYKDLVTSGNQKYMKFAFWNGFAVGGVCARIEPDSEQEGVSKLYIMTINVLPAYRRRGIGACPSSIHSRFVSPPHFTNPCTIPLFLPPPAATLLQHVLDEATKETSSSIVEVYLHVQTSNLEAKNFYLSHGFVETGVIANYYKRIEPPDCFILQRKLRV